MNQVDYHVPYPQTASSARSGLIDNLQQQAEETSGIFSGSPWLGIRAIMQETSKLRDALNESVKCFAMRNEELCELRNSVRSLDHYIRHFSDRVEAGEFSDSLKKRVFDLEDKAEEMSYDFNVYDERVTDALRNERLIDRRLSDVEFMLDTLEGRMISYENECNSFYDYVRDCFKELSFEQEDMKGQMDDFRKSFTSPVYDLSPSDEDEEDDDLEDRVTCHLNDIEAKVHETSARNDALLSAVSRIISFLVPFGLDSEDIGTVLMEKDNHNEDDDLTF